MITFKKGDLLASDAEALVNTVNTMGVMGKGIALQFKKAFPGNTRAYEKACKDKTLNIGTLLVTEDVSLMGGSKIIVNFPTKTNWRLPSEYIYIEAGLKELVRVINERKIKSIALPPLGAGNGGLDWLRVKAIIVSYLSDLDIDVQVYEPTSEMQEVLNQERTRLTPARAMLLSVLYDLVRHGEFVSEFAAEKTAYFLQRFGAEPYFNLKYNRNFYGPYSGKVRHVLYYLNGSYIMGYSAKDKKPFEMLSLLMDTEPEIEAYLNQPELEACRTITAKTKQFLKGFYSDFALELLSTIDFLKMEKKVQTEEEIAQELERWSNRKHTMFKNPRFIQIALNHLNTHLQYPE